VPLRLSSERPLDLVLQPEGTSLQTTCVDGVHTALIPCLQRWQIVVSRNHLAS